MTIHLKDKLAKFATYGRLTEQTKSIDMFTVHPERTWVLSEVMQQMFESGLLKKMVNTELLRRALEFFRICL